MRPPGRDSSPPETSSACSADERPPPSFGRTFLAFPPENRRELERAAEGGFVLVPPPPVLRASSAVAETLARIAGGALVPFLTTYESYLRRTSPAPIAQREVFLGLLSEWLRLTPGRWPLPEAEWRKVTNAARLRWDLPSLIEEEDKGVYGLAEIVEAIVPRQLAVSDETHFERHREWISRTFPTTLRYREGLAPPLPVDQVRAALRFPDGRDQTTFFLGVSPSEEGLIRDSLRASGRSGEVILVDDNEEVLEALSEIPWHEETRRAPRLLRADFTSPAFVEAHRENGDRVYLLYPQGRRPLQIGAALLRRGGRLVVQMVTGTIDWLGEVPRSGLPAEWAKLSNQLSVVLRFENVKPAIWTTTSELFPSGNFFLIADRK